MPTLFGPILGITAQGVRATATAIVGNGNATDCLRPIALADDWVEQTGEQRIQLLRPAGNPLAWDPDIYSPPSGAATRQRGNDLGRLRIDLGFTLISDATTAPSTAITRGSSFRSTFPGSDFQAEGGGVQRAAGGNRRHSSVLTTPTRLVPTQALDTVWTMDPYPPCDLEHVAKPGRQQLCARMRADQPAHPGSRSSTHAGFSCGRASRRLDPCRRLPDQHSVHHCHEHRRLLRPCWPAAVRWQRRTGIF